MTDLRQRRGGANSGQNPKKKSKRAKQEQAETAAKKQATKDKDVAAAVAKTPRDPKEETLWETFVSHPLVVVAPVILIPALVYYSLMYLLLQQPEVLTMATLGLVPGIRPAVRLSDERQVLIVGAMGGEVQQLAAKLSTALRIEVLHEQANAESYFCRDGTVSSMIGIRFHAQSEFQAMTNRSVRVINEMCVNRYKGSAKDGYFPKNYRPSNCSRYKQWSKCHSKECLAFLSTEWGCAATNSCLTPYRKVLHLVQHPVRTIQELMAKVCPGDAKTVHPVFLQLASAFLNENDMATDKNHSCLHTVSYYVLNFQNTMLAAQSHGWIDHRDQLESSSVCDIVRLAGFYTEPVFEPHSSRLLQVCSSMEHVPLLSRPNEEIARPLPKFTWDDFQQAGGKALVKDLRKLCRELGYDPDVVEPPTSPPTADEFDSSYSKKSLKDEY